MVAAKAARKKKRPTKRERKEHTKKSEEKILEYAFATIFIAINFCESSFSGWGKSVTVQQQSLLFAFDALLPFFHFLWICARSSPNFSL